MAVFPYLGILEGRGGPVRHLEILGGGQSKIACLQNPEKDFRNMVQRAHKCGPYSPDRDQQKSFSNPDYVFLNCFGGENFLSYHGGKHFSELLGKYFQTFGIKVGIWP